MILTGQCCLTLSVCVFFSISHEADVWHGGSSCDSVRSAADHPAATPLGEQQEGA